MPRTQGNRGAHDDLGGGREDDGDGHRSGDVSHGDLCEYRNDGDSGDDEVDGDGEVLTHRPMDRQPRTPLLGVEMVIVVMKTMMVMTFDKEPTIMVPKMRSMVRPMVATMSIAVDLVMRMINVIIIISML